MSDASATGACVRVASASRRPGPVVADARAVAAGGCRSNQGVLAAQGRAPACAARPGAASACSVAKCTVARRARAVPPSRGGTLATLAMKLSVDAKTITTVVLYIKRRSRYYSTLRPTGPARHVTTRRVPT